MAILQNNGHAALADKIRQELVHCAPHIENKSSSVTMEHLLCVNDRAVGQAYLDAGNEPDARIGSSKKVPVLIAAKHNAPEMVEVLFEGLKRKYRKEPEKILAELAQKEGGDKMTAETALRRFGHKDLADRIAADLDALEGRKSAAKHADTPSEAPPARSDALPPLKTDKTLTLTRLLDIKPDGRTNLQIFAEQGQLADVFAPHIWQGRREEMEKAWEQVPEEHRAQVNIEGTRAHLDAYNVRERFRPQTGDDLSHGF